MSSIFTGVKMADTSKDELLLGGGIHHITTTSLFTHGGKQVPACVHNIVFFQTRLFSAIFRLLQRITVKLKLKFAADIGRSGRHFSARFLW